jgi:hypothetical protein
MVGGTTLNARHSFLALFAAAGMALSSGSLQANTVPGDIVTGSLTSASRQSLNIDGRTYPVKDGSPAVAAAAHLTPGQSVTVQLDGPASSPSSHVINVVVHSGR